MNDSLDEQTTLDQLNRVVSSADFTAGPRTQKFLTHLVQEELAGRGEELRGTALAMDVFGRDASFDPNTDPVVRIEAVKLRKALEHFYLTSGASDTVFISVPKGQYRPRFEILTHTSPPDSNIFRPGYPALAIVAFTGSQTPKAQIYREGLPEEIGLELARFDQIKVVSGWHTEDDIVATNPDCDYVLRGTIRDGDGHIRVTVQLTRISTGALVWSERFDVTPDQTNVFEVQERIAKQCAVRLADAYGAVAEDLGAQYSGRVSSDASVFEALLAFQAHMRTSRIESLSEFFDLANAALKDNPSSGLANALVALGHIEQLTMGQKRLDEVQDSGRMYAENAIALSPHCQEALFAAAVYAQLAGDTVRFDRLISAAVAANPNGSLLMALAGGWIAFAGDVERGAELVRKATVANSVLPIWTNITLSLQDIIAGEFSAASQKVLYVDARECVGDWVLIAGAHALAGETALANTALSNISDPQFDVDSYLESLPFPSSLTNQLRKSFSEI